MTSCWPAARRLPAPGSLTTTPTCLCSDAASEPRSLADQGLQFKFLVPSSVVGAVLGRGGATVAAIKRDTGAYVQFTRPGTATNSPRDRMMIVAVEQRDQLASAIELVLQVRAVRGLMPALQVGVVRAMAPYVGCFLCDRHVSWYSSLLAAAPVLFVRPCDTQAWCGTRLHGSAYSAA